MNNTISGAILCILAILVLIGAGFVLSLTGITMKLFLTVNFVPLGYAILNVPFAIFLVLSSLALALILLIARNRDFVPALIFAEVAYLGGAFISAAIFGFLDFSAAILIGAVGVALLVKGLDEKEVAMKHFAKFRAGSSASNKVIALFAVGLFVAVIIFTASNQSYYKDSFSAEFMKVTIGNGLSLSDTTQELLISSIIASQKGTVEQIANIPELHSLVASGSADAIALDNKISAIRSNLDSPAVHDAIKEATKKVSLGEDLVGQMPAIKMVADYAWLLYAFEALILVLLLGGLIVKTLAALFYFAIGSFYKGPVVSQVGPKESA